MLWAGIIAGGVGLVLSARYSVAAVIPAGLFGLLFILCASPFADWTTPVTLATMAVMLCALNAGYVAGLALSCAWTRTAAKEKDAAFTGRAYARLR